MALHDIAINLSAQNHVYGEKATLARKERSSKIVGRRQLISKPNNKAHLDTVHMESIMKSYSTSTSLRSNSLVVDDYEVRNSRQSEICIGSCVNDLLPDLKVYPRANSMMQIDKAVNNSRGPPTFRLFGENYHLMGSLSRAKFAQLYVFDTQNEVQTRISANREEENNDIHEGIVKELKSILDENNVLVKAFHMVRESMSSTSRSIVKLRLIGKRGKDGRRYNLPSTSEVVALIVGDFDIDQTDRDIIVETRSGRLQRINQLNPAYLGLQYPLLFLYKENGYKKDVSLNKSNLDGRKGRLFQQFLVDGFSMIESARLNYICLNQEKFRCEMYKSIKEAILSVETATSSRGKHIILPSSFTGGPRYMI
ncbi:uncharacterized protein LOC107474925 [Arachis duranensis]|uniref:Uncharacterized protein LOC107474925 n=1 Tax=Arachis duranensis TaxID=130453 RepID=A0A6P4CFK6_ARADU|nr:uncharacterized protein LOC107474925 [Arachis duranensis]